MTKHQSISLLSLVDEKYILEANPINVSSVKAPILNIKWKRLSLIATSVLLSIVAITTSLVFLFSPVLGESGGNSSTTSANENIDGNRLPPLEIVYPLRENSSFVLVELQSIGETLSFEPSDNNYNCIMVECKVVEDFYKNLSKDMIINVPIRLPLLDVNYETKKQNRMQEDSTTQNLNEIKQISEDKVKQFLIGYKYAIIFIHNLQESNSFYNSKGERVKIEMVSNIVTMDNYFIPLENNIVSVGKVENFYLENNCVYSFPSKYIYGYTSFVYDGMPQETFEENIRTLYQRQINGVSTSLPTSNDRVDY